MKTVMDELMRRQLLAELRRAGYHEARYSGEHDAVFPMDRKFPGIQIRGKEIWMPRLGKEDQGRQRDLVYEAFRPMADKVEEMIYAWCHALPMKISDVQEFRLLSEYGKFILAARDDRERGLHFTTWEYSYDRSGVSHGHYTTDYEGAKRDFAIRSGLFPEKMFFTAEEIKQMYSALLFQGKNDDGLTFTQEQDLHGVIEKLERIDPGLAEQEASVPEPNRSRSHEKRTSRL